MDMHKIKYRLPCPRWEKERGKRRRYAYHIKKIIQRFVWFYNMYCYDKNIYRAKMERKIVHRPLVCGEKHDPFRYLVKKNQPCHYKTEALSALFAAFAVAKRANNSGEHQKNKPKNMRCIKMSKAKIFRFFVL
jgi:hypothetical protein